MTEYRVGQRVRVEEVFEGVVTGVERGYIYIDGFARKTSATSAYVTRTITVLSEPKPDEPTGRGAVVRDGEGSEWSLAERGEARPWRRLGTPWDWRDWGDIDAVEILFPGVE